MASPETTDGASKWWGHSMTIWGAFITAAATVLPAIGPLLGLDLTPDLIRELGDQVVEVAQALGALIGILMTIYGRTRATASLERRQVTLQL